MHQLCFFIFVRKNWANCCMAKIFEWTIVASVETTIKQYIQLIHKLLLFPVDHDSHEFFSVFIATFLMPLVCFKPITWYIEMYHVRTFFLCVAPWLFRTVWCSFTTCLSSRGTLIMVFVCHWTVSMAAVYQLKIKYDQFKFGVFFLDAKRPVSFPLEDQHLVNEHHVIRKSHDATQKKCSHVVHFNVLCDWFETNSQH